MKETRKPEENRWTVILWIVGFLMVIGLALFISQIVKISPATPTAPVLTVAFADGGTLEIIGTSVKERVVEIAPPKTFPVSLFSSKGSSGGSYGGLRFDTKEQAGKVISIRLSSEEAAAMLIEFRMTDASGGGMIFPSHLRDDVMVNEDNRLPKSGASNGSFDPVDMELQSLLAAMDAAGLQVLFQHLDPDTGWVNLMGPSLFHAPWPDRYITTLRAWRRDLPKLDFRAIRADGKVVEFSLPNPDLRTVASRVAPAMTLPHVHKARDFTLAVSNVRRLASPGNLPLAAVDLKLDYKGNPMPGLKDGPIRLTWGASPAADEWGNEVKFERHPIREETLLGAMVPLASQWLSLDLKVERTEDYPHSPDSGYVVLEGKVADDGLEILFEPGPDAALLGISNMPVCKISKVSSDAGDPTSDWKKVEMTIQGEGNQLETIQRRIGEIHHCEIHIFMGDHDESSGLAAGGMDGGISTNGESFHFDRHVIRKFPPEDLAPRTKIRVAMDAPIKSETIHLELNLPATVEPE